MNTFGRGMASPIRRHNPFDELIKMMKEHSEKEAKKKKK